MTACTLLALTLAVEPETLSTLQISDFSLRLRFTNTCSETIHIFPATAQMSIVAGWASTQWHLRVRSPDNTHQRALRTWNGPPEEPPTHNYYQGNRITLPSGVLG